MIGCVITPPWRAVRCIAGTKQHPWEDSRKHHPETRTVQLKLKAKTMETEKCKIAWVDFSKPYLIAVFIKPASKKKALLIFGVTTQHTRHN